MPHKVVAITGGSAGIGAATALHLANQGMSVALIARRRDALNQVASRCGTAAHAIQADVTDREQVRRAVADTIARFGRIDVWINNVGRGITRQPTQLVDEDIDAMMRMNVKTALYGIQEVLPHFKERGEGHIVNVSSMLGRVPHAIPRSAYSAAKHFLNALTANFRDEVQASHPGIQFSLVSPPLVPTDFGIHSLHGGPDSRKMPNPQPVEEVAAVIAEVIRTRAPDVYTRRGSHHRVVDYFSSLAADAEVTAPDAIRPRR